MPGLRNAKKDLNSPVPAVLPMLLLLACLLAVFTAATAWVYTTALKSLHIRAAVIPRGNPAEAQLLPPHTKPATTVTPPGTFPETQPAAIAGLLAEASDWMHTLTVTTVATCTGFVCIVGLGLVSWRRSSIRRMGAMARDWDECQLHLTEVNFRAQRLTSEKGRLDEELRQLNAELTMRVEERTANLERAHAELVQELNDRRQAEKTLTLQSKELERSKGVLEMHVHARTMELRKLQHQYESILNSAGEGIYGLDLQGYTTFVNPAAAKLTGWKVEELSGRFESEVFRPTEPPRQQDDPAAPGAHGSERLFTRKDGSTFLVEYVRTPIKEEDQVLGEVVIFKDITERRQTEQTLTRKAAELARSNAELEQFAFVASHDLQEPLRKIQAFGDRLKSKVDAAKLQDGLDYLDRMQSAAARMRTLINDLLTFSRVISSSQPFASVDLNAVVKEVLADLEVSIEQRRAQVEVGDLPTIDADPMQMRQLFQNLIGNALKFQPPGNLPLVKVQSQLLVVFPPVGAEDGEDQTFCEVTVQDNGIGFDEKYLDKVFAVFQRLHGRSEYEGTGVGLAVCRRITDRHGGVITARSQPGEGATFIVRLPIRQAVQTGTAPSEAKEAVLKETLLAA